MIVLPIAATRVVKLTGVGGAGSNIQLVMGTIVVKVADLSEGGALIIIRLHRLSRPRLASRRGLSDRAILKFRVAGSCFAYYRVEFRGLVLISSIEWSLVKTVVRPIVAAAPFMLFPLPRTIKTTARFGDVVNIAFLRGDA